MFSKFRIGRPSPAMIVGIVALVVAMGGTATAALRIGSRQIVNNSVTTADVKNRSLLARDFRRGQLPRGAQGPQGAQGPAGAQGPRGLQGQTGPTGPSDGFATAPENSAVVNLSGTPTAVKTLNLPAGKYLVFSSVLLNNNDAETEDFTCSLTTDGDSEGNSTATVDAEAESDRQTENLLGAADLPSGGTATLSCTSSAASANAVGARLTAVRVGNLTVTP